MIVHDEPGTISFKLGGLVRHMSIPKFGAAIGLYMEEFMSVEDFLRLHRHIHHSPSRSSEEFTNFRQYYVQRFDSIDAALQQICQHSHIALLKPMTHDIDLSDDEDH
ncbi:hypothetical protein PVK06_002566 [Gossypium arboreum]|uniref:Uncharacterized protein n=1 Tax=Gossypium arboreum TaxID=29729 RepID=A0ABR0R3W6_GOSAR|nr:hypothetical protein PVK06_002566 [Gossypium arboreum]